MRSMMQRGALLSASVLALGAIAMGCDGGDDGASFLDDAYGGQVQLQKLNLGGSPLALGFAEFYSAYTPATGETISENPYGALPLDQCVPYSSLSSGTDGSYTSANVGDVVRIVGDAGTLTLGVNTFGDYTYYESATPGSGDDFPGASFADVEFDTPATTLADALSIPGDVALTAPDPSQPVAAVPTSGDMTFTWTPVGAEEVIISFQAAQGGLCRVNDDGSFNVPAAFLANVSTNGFVVFVAADLGFANVDLGAGERSVLTVGFNGQAWQY